jgi:cell division protein FtsZ
MAMGRASGEHRVEKAILNALDSPLLYGNDIGKAKRILFNIYASDEYPIFVKELQEIDDFFDQLDPNIDVIWGTATDDNLGEDAKVTILATGMEEKLEDEIPANAYRNEDDYYEEVIKKLYKPVVKPTMATVITQQELPFEVEPAPEPEPAVVPEPEEEKEPTILDKWKVWLNNLMSVVTE